MKCIATHLDGYHRYTTDYNGYRCNQTVTNALGGISLGSGGYQPNATQTVEISRKPTVSGGNRCKSTYSNGYGCKPTHNTAFECVPFHHYSPNGAISEMWVWRLCGHGCQMEISSLWAPHISAWIGALQTELAAEETVKKRRYHLSCLARAFPTDSPWSLTTEQIAGWLCSRGWSRATVRSYRCGIAKFYIWAVRVGHIASSPATDLPRVRSVDPVPRPADPQAVRAALVNTTDRVRLMIRIGVETGIRRGECAVIHLRDVITSDDGADCPR